MGGQTSKTSSHCFYITLEQQNAALNICSKLDENIVEHNKRIVERFESPLAAFAGPNQYQMPPDWLIHRRKNEAIHREAFHFDYFIFKRSRESNNLPLLLYFSTYPDYRKYFMATTNVEASKISSNPEVVRHWETVLKWLGYVAKAYSRKKQNIEYQINYLALYHKDMDITLEDLEKYTFVFITYLNSNMRLTRSVVDQLMEFMNLLFRSIDEKIVLIKIIEQKNEDSIITPETLQLSNKRSACYCGCVRLYKTREPFDLPYALHFNDDNFWSTRKEFWRQQLYWIKEEKDFRVPRITSPLLFSERNSSIREDGSVKSPTVVVSRDVNLSLLKTFPQSSDKIRMSDEKNTNNSISQLVVEFLNNLERDNNCSYSNNLLLHQSGSNVNVNQSDSDRINWSEQLSEEIFKASENGRMSRSLSAHSWSKTNMMKLSTLNEPKIDHLSNPVSVQTIIADNQSLKATQYEKRSSTFQRPSNHAGTHGSTNFYRRNSLARKRRREMKRRYQNEKSTQFKKN